MAVLNTRLKESDREATSKSLNSTLNNIVRFWEQPIRDKNVWARLWNSKFPPALFDAMKVCNVYGYTPNTYEASAIRVVVQHGGKHYSSQIMLNWMPGELSVRKPVRMTTQMRASNPHVLEVRQRIGHNASSVVHGILVSPADYENFLGEHTETFLEWITSTAKLRIELIEAKQTIDNLLSMAKTAGQIKRMVPDLLQYLPVDLRKAYRDQVRASSLPFEWAPYPRDRVERLLTALGKGHLLAGMGKEHQSGWEVGGLDNVMWGAEVTVIMKGTQTDDIAVDND